MPKDEFHDKNDDTRRTVTGNSLEVINNGKAAKAFDKMYNAALEWEAACGGKASAFFELVTENGSKIKCATKNSKRKV
jgi:hypothetical protein